MIRTLRDRTPASGLQFNRQGQTPGSSSRGVKSVALPINQAYASTYANFETQSIMNQRHASLFRNGRNQAVRIPREFELVGTEVLIEKDGPRLIITPIAKRHLAEIVSDWEPLEDGLPEIPDLPPQERDLF